MAGKIKKLASWKKIALGIIAGILVLLFVSLSVILLFFYVLGDAMCNTSDIYQLENSPNGLYKAIVYEFDCGATTNYSTDISVIPFNGKTPDRRGNIAIIEGRQDWNNANVTWVDNTHLLIEYDPVYEVSGRDRRHWLFIKIDYSPEYP